MDQFGTIAIDNLHTVPQSAMNCRPGGLNEVYGPNRPTPSINNICGKYINIFTRCTIRNQHDILKTAVADVSKGQTNMSYKGEIQTLTNLSMKYQVRPGETYRTINNKIYQN